MNKSIRDYKPQSDSIRISDNFFKDTRTIMLEAASDRKQSYFLIRKFNRITAITTLAAACLIFVFAFKTGLFTKDTDELASYDQSTDTSIETTCGNLPEESTTNNNAQKKVAGNSIIAGAVTNTETVESVGTEKSELEFYAAPDIIESVDTSSADESIETDQEEFINDESIEYDTGTHAIIAYGDSKYIITSDKKLPDNLNDIDFSSISLTIQSFINNIDENNPLFTDTTSKLDISDTEKQKELINTINGILKKYTPYYTEKYEISETTKYVLYIDSLNIGENYFTIFTDSNETVTVSRSTEIGVEISVYALSQDDYDIIDSCLSDVVNR